MNDGRSSFSPSELKSRHECSNPPRKPKGAAASSLPGTRAEVVEPSGLVEEVKIVDGVENARDSQGNTTQEHENSDRG